MKIFSRLSGGKKQLKKSLQACEDKVISLEQELAERNKQLNALEGKQVEDNSVKNDEVKILEEKNNEYAAKIEDLTSRNIELEAANKQLGMQIDEFNTLCSDYKEQVDNNKETQTQFTLSESAKEMQDIIEILERKNRALEAALAVEKKKSQRKKKDASDRRARFKERVQNLTRKLSDDELSEEESDDTAPTESLFDTPKAGSKPM